MPLPSPSGLSQAAEKSFTHLSIPEAWTVFWGFSTKKSDFASQDVSESPLCSICRGSQGSLELDRPLESTPSNPFEGKGTCHIAH